MERTGLVRGFFNFADALIGWVPGGFAYATLIAAVLFGAISGSSTAMAAAMSVIAYPEMIKRGCPKWTAAGVITSAGGIALLISPSITLILFGVITEISIVDLFFAGVVPGIMLAISDAVIIVCVSIFIVKLPAGTFDLKRCWTAFLEALPALLMPVLVLGGLYGGVFTPTEAGAAAASYALAYGVLFKGRVFINELMAVTRRTMNLTTLVFFLLGCVGIFKFFFPRQYGLAARNRCLGRRSWAVKTGLPIRFNGDITAAVDVADRGRHFGADRADLFPGGAVFGR